MTADEFAAVEQARGLLARPAQVSVLRARAYPGGMRMLLRVAAHDEAALRLAAERTGDSPAALHEACVFYVQQLMLDEASDSYRILGVDSRAPIAEIKAHYGLLMRWMHPDRNPDAWEVVFAERVTRAWNDLRTVDRRSAYDSVPATAGTEPDAGAEDWVGQAAPFKARPVEAAHARAAAVARSEEMQKPAAKPVPFRWLGAAAAAASLAAMVLFVAWPQRGSNEGPPDIAEPGTEATAAPGEKDAPAPPAVVSPATTSDSTSRVAAQGSTTPTRTVAAAIPPAPSGSGQPAGTPPRILAAQPAPARVPPMERVARLKTERSSLVATLPSVAQVATRTKAPARTEPRPVDVTVSASSDPSDSRSVAPTTVNAPSIAARDVPVEVRDAPAQAGIVPATPAKAPDLDQASLLIGRFAHAYQQGDTAALASLFTADATSQGKGIEQIRAAYDRLFARTSERSISIRDIKWRVQDERALATGQFEISQAKDKQDKGSVSRGTIRFDIEQHQDRVLISRLEHIDRGL